MDRVTQRKTSALASQPIHAALDRFCKDIVKSELLSAGLRIETALREQICELTDAIAAASSFERKVSPGESSIAESASSALKHGGNGIGEIEEVVPCVQAVDTDSITDGGPRAVLSCSVRALHRGDINLPEESLHLLAFESEPVNDLTGDVRCSRPSIKRQSAQLILPVWFLISEFVQSENFDLLVAGFIILNVCVVAVQVEHVARYWTEQVPLPFVIANHFFCFIFFTEVVLRAAIYQRTFCKYVYNNLIDTTAMLLMFTEEAVSLSWFWHHGRIRFHVPGLGVLRILRIFRLLRIVRRMSLLQLFAHLRIVIVSVVESGSSLFWACVAILVVSIIMAVFLTDVVNEYKMGHRHVLEEEKPPLLHYFGSVGSTLLTLYEVCLDGLHWSEPMDELINHCPFWLPLMFVMYISVVKIAMMNVITSIFVASALKHAEADRHMLLQQKMQLFFRDADVNSDGTINWDEFHMHINHPILVEFFNENNIHEGHAQMVFDSLDADKSGEVDIDELIGGMATIRNRLPVSQAPEDAWTQAVRNQV